VRILPSVLWQCATQHHKIGKFGHQTMDRTITTDIAKIRAITQELARLDYETAVGSIARRNALHAGHGM
jgi:hypothetical protein